MLALFLASFLGLHRGVATASTLPDGPAQSCGSALVQRKTVLKKRMMVDADEDGAEDQLKTQLVKLQDKSDDGGMAFSFEPVGGQDRACRATNPTDNHPSYYSLFNNVKTLEECKTKCRGAPSEPPEPPTCPVTAQGQTFGSVKTSRVNECSGLAASRTTAGLYWANNDSGDRQRLYGFDKFGTHKATLYIDGAHARDWEDIAIGPGPMSGRNYLYIADTGDNCRHRDNIQIYRALEPSVPRGQDRTKDIKIRAQRFDIRYPDGSHDCEAMFIDQGPAASAQGTAGRVYIITKSHGRGHLYWADLPAKPTSLTFTKSSGGSLAIPGLVTGADISPSGSFIVVRTYGDLFMWPRPTGKSVDQSMVANRCAVNRKGERQGEAVAFGSEGDHYITVSEGKHPTIWYFTMASSFQESVTNLIDRPAEKCQGIEYSQQNKRCEVWNRDVEIHATADVPGSECFRYGGTFFTSHTTTPSSPTKPLCNGVVLRDVDLTCPSEDGSGCKVLANNMRGKTCREYCSRNGLECVDGWEEEDESCVAKATLGCDKTYGTTSDVLCQCGVSIKVTKL